MAVEGTLSTAVPSFGFPSNMVMGMSPYIPAPVTSGSPAGVPMNNALGSSSPNQGAGGTPAGHVAYGEDKAKQGPTKQPIFWAVALFALGVIMLAHAAHVEVRD